MLKPEDVRIIVEYTDGYQERYTRARLKQLDLRRKREAGLDSPPAREDKNEQATA